MPARKTPSKGGKPDKIFRDALLIALKREDIVDGKKINKVMRLATKLVELGCGGDTSAIKEIRDTVDGRPAQSVALGQDPDLGPIGVTHDVRPPLTRSEWLKLHSIG